MDILNNIIDSMNKEQVRHFKLFLSRSHASDGRLDVKLFDYMRKSGEKYDESKIVRSLYPNGDKNSFYRLRNRLLRDVNKSLMIQHYDDDDFVYTLYLLSLEKYYLSKSKFRIAIFFLKKAEAQSIKTENYELLDIIYGEFIRLSNDLAGINPEHYIKLRVKNSEQIRQIREIDDILAVVSHKMKLTQNFSLDENPVLPLLQKTVRQYSSDKELSKSPKLRFKIYHAVTQILLQKRNYEALEQYLLDTYNEFTTEFMFNRNNHETKLQMLVFIINTLFKNGKTNDSLKYADKLRQAMDEHQRIYYDKYLFYYYNSLVINYSRTDSTKAIETLKEMKANLKIYNVPFYQMAIELNLAVSHFDRSDYHQSIRHLNKLYTLDGYRTSDEAFKFKIAIAELLIRYELKDYDVLESKMRLIRKDFKEFFNKRSSVREILMVKIISTLMQKESLRTEKALITQAKQLILSPSKKEASDADILSYKSWLSARM
jgi:hypothetical protein